jgi:hypothetical protein
MRFKLKIHSVSIHSMAWPRASSISSIMLVPDQLHIMFVSLFGAHICNTSVIYKQNGMIVKTFHCELNVFPNINITN